MDLKDTLMLFDPVSLEEMDGVGLMDRMDTKYAFNRNMLPLFLAAVKDDYRILDVKGNRVSRYESLYFDTKDFILYNFHHSGRLNRLKVRFRKYVESDLHFFEIKTKNNKSRTIKKRIGHPRIENAIEEVTGRFLKKNTTLDPATLEQKLWVNFSRITLVSRLASERVTIDIDLSFKNDNTIKEAANLVIAEVKQEKSGTSPFVRMMKHYHIRQGTISKYCYGVMNLFSSQRFNNFKPQLLLLNKITYDTAARAGNTKS